MEMDVDALAMGQAQSEDHVEVGHGIPIVEERIESADEVGALGPGRVQDVSHALLGTDPGLREAADGLQALALGMREVAAPTRHLVDREPGATDATPARPSSTTDVPDYGPARPPGSRSRRAGDQRRG